MSTTRARGAQRRLGRQFVRAASAAWSKSARASRSITSRAEIGAVRPSAADPLAAAHQHVGEREAQRHAARRACRPSASDEAKAMEGEQSIQRK